MIDEDVTAAMIDDAALPVQVLVPPAATPIPQVAETDLTMAAGGDPAEFKMPEALADYWLHGEGAAKVRWCTDGSFDRARKLLLKEGVPPHMVDGTVANLYFRACGKRPGHVSATAARAAIESLLLRYGGAARFQYDPHQRRDDEGQWAKGGGAGLPDIDLGADADDDGTPSAISIFGGRSVDGITYVAAFEDPDGELLPGGGRGIAFRDEMGAGTIDDAADLEESTYVRNADVDEFTKALDLAVNATSGRDYTTDPAGGGLIQLGAWSAAGIHIAAFDDADNHFGLHDEDGGPVIAVGHSEGTPWAGLPANDFDILTPDVAAAMAAAIRAASTSRPTSRQGLDPKVDKLRLDGKLELPAGERLIASAKARDSEASALAMALSGGADGLRLRVGMGASDWVKDWRGERSSNEMESLLFEPSGVAQLRENAAKLPGELKQHVKDYREFIREVDAFGGLDDDVSTMENGVWTIDDQFTPEQQQKIRRASDLLNSEYAVAEGVLASGPWGDLRYEIFTHSDFNAEPGEWGGSGESAYINLRMRRPSETDDVDVGDVFRLDGPSAVRSWAKTIEALITAGQDVTG